MEKVELKVSSKSKPSSIAGAIAEFIKKNNKITIKTIGAGALNQAIKGIAIARGFVVTQGIDLNCTPSFYSAEINGEEISAIMLTINKM